MAIHNTVMYENVNKAMAKQKVALEVRNVVRLVILCMVNFEKGVVFHISQALEHSYPGCSFSNFRKTIPCRTRFFFFTEIAFKQSTHENSF